MANLLYRNCFAAWITDKPFVLRSWLCIGLGKRQQYQFKKKNEIYIFCEMHLCCYTRQLFLLFVAEHIQRREWLKRSVSRLNSMCKTSKNRVHLPTGLSAKIGFTESVNETKTPDQGAIVTHDLGKKYGKHYAVNNINLTIEKGKWG